MKFIGVLILLICLVMPVLSRAEDEAAPEAKHQSADTGIIIGTISKDSVTISSSAPRNGCVLKVERKLINKLTKNSRFAVLDKFVCDSYDSDQYLFYKIMLDNNIYYINQDDVQISESDKKRLNTLSFDELQELQQHTEIVLKKLELEKLGKALKAVSNTSKTGIAIFENSIYKTSEYSGGTGFKIKFANTSNKTIKYVNFTVIGLNPVNDPVKVSKKSASITVKGVGPIAKNEIASYNWDYMWLSDLVQTHKLKSITIEYMDGSKKTITNIKEITLADAYAKAITESGNN